MFPSLHAVFNVRYLVPLRRYPQTQRIKYLIVLVYNIFKTKPSEGKAVHVVGNAVNKTSQCKDKP